ncbi:RNA-directed DNA polymerase, eukaryota, Reverse transcriptase zinc-binding domain protein [Artemisia annua]|uniref:RNA-directed DNA polymerase, eukaryota, Reverse transcriptase zinc-binding domain protein n=1 Tax=Artemisia annua TaxID=35608 RepID=A0A2U1LSV1_ARTAN|nr:RNA-directed DNA polymerase, eukaryota, Reverse transcriptase zinc-binding domain protein [Artemisia annua]
MITWGLTQSHNSYARCHSSSLTCVKAIPPILHIRDVLREHIVIRIGDGCDTSAWFDNWCFLGPLNRLISKRDIFDAGLSLDCRVADLVTNGEWIWPTCLSDKFPFLTHLPPPLLFHDRKDRVVWKSNGGIIGNFSVKAVWNDLIPEKPVVPCWIEIWFVKWYVPAFPMWCKPSLDDIWISLYLEIAWLTDFPIWCVPSTDDIWKIWFSLGSLLIEVVCSVLVIWMMCCYMVLIYIKGSFAAYVSDEDRFMWEVQVGNLCFCKVMHRRPCLWIELFEFGWIGYRDVVAASWMLFFLISHLLCNKSSFCITLLFLALFPKHVLGMSFELTYMGMSI